MYEIETLIISFRITNKKNKQQKKPPTRKETKTNILNILVSSCAAIHAACTFFTTENLKMQTKQIMTICNYMWSVKISLSLWVCV